MTANICAPGKYDSKLRTCFTLDQLIALSTAYNKYVTKIKMDPQNILSKKSAEKPLPIIKLIVIKPDKSYLLAELRNRFDNICNGDDLCLTKQAFMNEVVSKEYKEITENTFRVEGPTDPLEWLSTSHINKLMKQYEIPFKDFEFMGAVPSNCDELNFCSLFNLDFKKLAAKGKTKIGIIFNHDVHGEPGSHWVSMYIDMAKGNIYYCDSTGREPVGRIEQTVKKFMAYCENIGKKCTYKQNTNKYQKDSSECGIYSCNFIIRMLTGETFNNIVNKPLKFDEINLCRDAFFSNLPVSGGKKAIPKSCDPMFVGGKGKNKRCKSK